MMWKVWRTAPWDGGKVRIGWRPEGSFCDLLHCYILKDVLSCTLTLCAPFCMCGHFYVKLRNKCIQNGEVTSLHSMVRNKKMAKKRKGFSPLPHSILPPIVSVIWVSVLKRTRGMCWGCGIWSVGTIYDSFTLGLPVPFTDDYRFTFCAGRIIHRRMKHQLSIDQKQENQRYGWGKKSSLTNPLEM